MQENMKKYMENYGNPAGANEINNLTSLKFFSITTAIQKNLCLASYSSHLFLERKELLEVPYNNCKIQLNKFRRKKINHKEFLAATNDADIIP